MHIFHKPPYRSASEWFHDTQLLHEAYSEMRADRLLDAEIDQLEFKYLKKHLIGLVGEDDAERILREHGL